MMAPLCKDVIKVRDWAYNIHKEYHTEDPEECIKEVPDYWASVIQGRRHPTHVPPSLSTEHSDLALTEFLVPQLTGNRQ